MLHFMSESHCFKGHKYCPYLVKFNWLVHNAPRKNVIIKNMYTLTVYRKISD